MIRVPTLIPKSLVARAVEITNKGFVEAVWFLLVSALILAVGYYAIILSSGGMIAVVAGVALGYLINDDIRQAIDDLYKRRFYSIRVDV